MESHYILFAIIVGAGATFITDVWNLFLKRSFNIQSLNFCYLGRWILYMPKGIFRHTNIKATEPRSLECLTGWVAHYTIGITLTLFFIIVIVSFQWLMRPDFFPALFYGIATVIFPLFILQPSFGLGIASSKTPNPMQARLKSMMTHIVFGAGLWLSAQAFRLFL